MQRNYLGQRLAPLALALTGLTAVATLPPADLRAAALFEAQPVDPSRFAVLARPVGREDWTLLVLEQLRPRPLCWQSRSDGLVDASLNRFDFSGICGRYIDSNGYSLRFAAGEGNGDAGSGLRLHVEPVGNELQLQASSADLAGVLVVGRAPLPARVRDAFVAIQLEAGWELQRRSYGGQALNHLYFSHAGSARELLAQAAGSGMGGPGRPVQRSTRGFPPLRLPPPPPPPLTTAEREAISPIAPPRRGGRQRPLSQARISPQPLDSAAGWGDGSQARPGLQAQRGTQAFVASPGRVIALQVIPFQE